MAKRLTDLELARKKMKEALALPKDHPERDSLYYLWNFNYRVQKIVDFKTEAKLKSIGL
jgi:hypothetical protein